MDSRVAVLFANQPYYLEDCRKNVSIEDEVRSLLAALEGASSAEIRRRTAPLSGTTFERQARDVYAKALFAELKTSNRPEDWEAAFTEFSGTAFAPRAQQAHREAVLHLLRGNPSVPSILARAPLFEGTDLEDSFRVLLHETARRDFTLTGSADALERPCEYLRRRDPRFVESCGKSIAEAKLSARIRQIRASGAKLADWLEIDRAAPGSSFAAEIEAGIEASLQRTADLTELLSACEQIAGTRLQNVCRARKHDLAIHLVRSAPNDDNIRKAFAACRGENAECERTTRGYQFGLRLKRDLEEIASSRASRVVADEIARSRTFWQGLERELNQFASEQFGATLLELSPQAPPFILRQIELAERKSNDLTNEVSKRWSETEELARKKSEWLNLVWITTKLETIVARLDRELRGALIARRLDPENKRAQQLVELMIRVRNRLTEPQKERIEIKPVKVAIAALKTFAPKPVAFAVDAIEALTEGGGTDYRGTIEEFEALLGAI